MEKPQRITLSRKKGWRMPPRTVKVDRSSILLGNPFRPIDPKNRKHAETAVAYFREWLQRGGGSFQCGPETGVTLAFIPEWHRPDDIKKVLPKLRGVNLACWCKQGMPCHADVLLELANA
jgi:hypothetical protein